MSDQYQLIVCIVNAGFTELVMDAAKAAGARGGTVMGARGTANKEAESFFHITIQPEKEMVMILVPADIRDDVLHALYTRAGIDTPGQGIAFSLPVDDVVGLGMAKPIEQAQPQEEQEKAPEDEPKPEEGQEEPKEPQEEKQEAKPHRKRLGRK